MSFFSCSFPCFRSETHPPDSRETDPEPSNGKIFTCALLIILGIGGLVVGGAGIAGSSGAIATLSQIDVILMISLGGGGGACCFIGGIIYAVKNCKPHENAPTQIDTIIDKIDNQIPIDQQAQIIDRSKNAGEQNPIDADELLKQIDAALPRESGVDGNELNFKDADELLKAIDDALPKENKVDKPEKSDVQNLPIYTEPVKEKKPDAVLRLRKNTNIGEIFPLNAFNRKDPASISKGKEPVPSNDPMDIKEKESSSEIKEKAPSPGANRAPLSAKEEKALIYGPDAKLWKDLNIIIKDTGANASRPTIPWTENDPYFDEPYQNNYVLVYIPKRISFKGKDGKEVKEQDFTPQTCQDIKVRFMGVNLKPEQQNAEITSGWVLLSKKVLPGSGGKSYFDQKKIIEAQNSFYLPHIVEMVVLNLVVQAATGQKLNDKQNNGRCDETVHGSATAVGFTDFGLNVTLAVVDDKKFGVAVARRKF